MKKKGLFGISAVLVSAILIVLTVPVDGLCQDKKVYKLKFAWNDIWGPKFRASQIESLLFLKIECRSRLGSWTVLES